MLDRQNLALLVDIEEQRTLKQSTNSKYLKFSKILIFGPKFPTTNTIRSMKCSNDADFSLFFILNEKKYEKSYLNFFLWS